MVLAELTKPELNPSGEEHHVVRLVDGHVRRIHQASSQPSLATERERERERERYIHTYTHYAHTLTFMVG
jgi:hypothetical protein